MKTGKLLVASGALAAMLTMTLSGAVLANGVGDLYVASAAGVLEIHVKTSTVVSTIPMVPAPLSLAFTPDGTTLYACGGGSAIIPIDIATLDVQSSVIMPGPVSVLAFPAGQILVGDLHAVLVLGLNRDLHHRQRVDVQVVDERLLRGDLGRLDTGDLFDDLGETGDDFLLTGAHCEAPFLIGCATS